MSEDAPLTERGSADPQVACPRCKKPANAEWLICPYCDAVLQGVERGARAGALDSFLHRPGAKWRIVKLVFAIFGCVGLLIWGSTAFLVVGLFDVRSLTGCWIAPFLIFASGMLYIFSRSRKNAEERKLGAMLLNILAWAGAVTALACLAGGALALIEFVIILATG